MSESSPFPTISVLEDREADAIDALESALALAEKKGDEDASRKLRDELSEARLNRTKRITDENWTTLEHLVGRRLRR